MIPDIGRLSPAQPIDGGYVPAMATDPSSLGPQARQFLTARGLASLTLLRRDGSPHVTPVGFTWDPDAFVARVICDGGSVKAKLAAAGAHASICQVDGVAWLTFEGTPSVSGEPARVDDAVRRYSERYRVPRANPNRVVIEIAVARVLGPTSFLLG
ncbi:MAG: class F420-dependent enzyme [Pseudonocardiales bacterium]|nr:class F420-dependent enzyme [Pseudonocardiales bacterium]